MRFPNCLLFPPFNLVLIKYNAYPPICKILWHIGPSLTITAEKALKISFSDCQVKKYLDTSAKGNWLKENCYRYLNTTRYLSCTRSPQAAFNIRIPQNQVLYNIHLGFYCTYQSYMHCSQTELWLSLNKSSEVYRRCLIFMVQQVNLIHSLFMSPYLRVLFLTSS